VTRQPDVNELEGTAQAGLSFTHDGGPNYHGAAAVSVPIVNDRLAVRAGGYYSRDGGYIDDVQRGENNVGNADIYGGRLDLLFTPTDALSIRLTAFAQNIDRDGTALADYTLTGEPVDGELDQRRVIDEPFRQRFRLVSGTISYDFGGAVLTSITSYQNIDTFFQLDGSSVYVPLLNLLGLPVGAVGVSGGADTDKFTQEVRLASSGDGMFEWIVGGFYTNEDSVSAANLVPFTASGDLFPLDLLTSDLPSTYEEIAGFGNVTVHLSDRFDVTGGLRWARNEQSYTQNATGVFPVPNVPTQNSSEDVVTYLANARYRFSDHAAAYVRYATGYRPGGPNVVTFDPVTGAPLGEPTFESDTLASYEIGFKGETVDRSFGIDVAVYHLDWDNILISSVTNGFNSYKNAEGAKVDGAELTLTARPSRSLTITGAFAYQDARLAADAPELGGSKGDPLPNVPRYTAAINADYRFDAPGFQPTAGATLRFVSDRRSGFDANPAAPQYNLGDYATLDLRAGASFGRFDAQVFVRNLFDDRGQISASTAFAVGGFAPARVAILQPRTIGVSVATRF
jgi:outer membrane receptor protein involved in Fe transport